MTIRVTWKLPASRQFGESSVLLPRSEYVPLADTALIDGGSLVSYRDVACGLWEGLTEVPVGDADTGSLTLRAVHLASLVGDAAITRQQVFLNCTAGTIVGLSCQDCLQGTAGQLLRPGTFVEAPPLIGRYELRGQTLGQVLSDMVSQTGQEWRVREDGQLDWIGFEGREQPRHLVEGVNLTQLRQEQAAPSLAEVAVRSSSGVYREITTADPGLWHHTEVIESAGSGRLGVVDVARQHLIAGRHHPFAFGGKVARAFANDVGLKVGDVFMFHSSRLGVRGVTATVRVTSVTVDDVSEWLDVELSAFVSAGDLPLHLIVAGSGGAPTMRPQTTTQYFDQIGSDVRNLQDRLALAQRG